MQPRISLITLGARDMAREAAFYDALGWQRANGGEGVIAYDLLGQTLGLFGLEDLAKDIGVPVETLGHGALTLAHNLGSREEVDALSSEVAQLLAKEDQKRKQFKARLAALTRNTKDASPLIPDSDPSGGERCCPFCSKPFRPGHM